MGESLRGAAGFVSAQRANRRASLVILGGTFLLLTLVVTAIIAALGAYSDTQCNGYGYECTTTWVWRPGAMAATVLAVVAYLAIAWACSAQAALSFSHARIASGPEWAKLRELVSQMAIAAGIPEPTVYIVDDPAPNAFATGRSPSRAAVTVTTGLLAVMSHRELRGVIAHELGHIKNRDIAITTIAVLAVGLIATLAQIALRLGLVFGRGRRGGEIGGALALIGLVLYLFAVPAGLLLKAALSRQRESLADATAVEFTREPAGLRSALEKLEADTTVLQRPSPAIAHLWIESPLERGKSKGLAGSIGRMFDTHPPLAQRIATLRGYEGLDPGGRGPNDARPGQAGPPAGHLPHGSRPLATSGLPTAPGAAAAWHPDPTHRAELRWWDGNAWTNWGSTGGHVHSSPLHSSPLH